VFQFGMRARDVPLGFAGLRLDAALGYQLGDLTRDTIDPTAMPMPIAHHERAAGELGIHDDRAGIALTRGEYATFDVELAHEDRIATWLALHRGATTITLRSFAARTEVTSTTGHTDRAITGGGQTQLDRDVRGTHVTASAEVARSFYARLDADPSPHPDLAGRLLVTLSRHVRR
jgi:hypothetical protein